MKVLIFVAIGAGFLVIVMAFIYFAMFAGGPPPDETVTQVIVDPNTIDTDGDGFPDVREIQMGTSPTDPEEFPGSHSWVVTAATNIDENALITPVMVDIRRQKQSEIPIGVISSENRANVARVINSVARSRVSAGEHLKPGDVFDGIRLSYLVPRYKRAVTVPITALSAVAYLVKPGDVVDIVGNFTVERHDGTTENLTKIVVQGATVLALDQMMSDMPTAPIAADTAASGPPVQSEAVPTMATLAVTPMEAERLLFAASAAGQANLRMLLRSPNAADQVRWTPGATRDNVFGDQHTLKPIDVEIYRGTSREVVGLNPVLNQERLTVGEGGAR